MTGYLEKVIKFGGKTLPARLKVPNSDLNVDMTDFQKPLESNIVNVNLSTTPKVKVITNYDDMITQSHQIYTPDDFNTGALWLGGE